MERLTPLATAFLDAEDADPHASLVIGSTAVFTGPAPSYDEFVRSVEGRLALVPRYRQKVRTVPFDLGAPAWVDDPRFDVRWHIRNTALPRPGGRQELARLVGRVMSRRMDRDRPLWESWIVEGLPEGRWALVSKLHHCLADGVSGTDLYRLLLDVSPQPAPPVEDTWRPHQGPSGASMLGRSAWDAATAPVEGVRAAAGLLRSPLQTARRAGRTAMGLATLGMAAAPAAESSLLGPIGESRRYTWTTTSLGDIRVVRRALGGTVNDVALAAIAGGFRELLLARGEQPGPHTLRSLVPVSTRAPGATSVPDNQVSLMLPYLPVEVADPVDRLAAVRDRLGHLRARHEPEAGEVLTTASELGPYPPVAAGIRLALHLPQRQIVTVTTNVPGPTRPLYALGREVEQMLPYVPIADRVRIGVAMFSYGDVFTFGITGDYDTTPDLEVLPRGIDRAMADLLDASGRAA